MISESRVERKAASDSRLSTFKVMFCIKCGAKNSFEAVYCQKCGALFEAEEETQIARSVKIERRETDNSENAEREIFSIRPTLMFVKIGYGSAALGALLLVALLAVLYEVLKIPVWFSIIAGLALFLIPAFYHLRHKIVRYTLTDSKIEIDEGLISKTTRNVPLRTIQDVTVSATVPQRMLGLGNLIIENAGETSSRIVLKNINSPKKYADVLLKQMRSLNK
jgi:membrane protein YdbS with pleckstrin-like domain/ribosomal protein L40E